MSHVSKQTLAHVAAKQDAMSAQQKAAYGQMMQESFDEAQSVATTRLQFAHLVAKERLVIPTGSPVRTVGGGPADHNDNATYAEQVFALADSFAQEHHRRATQERLAWFALKGVQPPMQVADAAKRMGLEVAKPEATPPSLVVAD